MLKRVSICNRALCAMLAALGKHVFAILNKRFQVAIRITPLNSHRFALPSSRSGGAAKTILIGLGIFGVVATLSCVGIGVATYLWFQKNLGQVAVSDPAEIRALTTKLTDITIPPEFQPQAASSAFGMTTVIYQWCPNGNCPTIDDIDDEADEYQVAQWGSLSLISFGSDQTMPSGSSRECMENSFSEQNLDEHFENHTTTEVKHTIRGQECTFYFARGEVRTESDFDEPEEEPNPEAAVSDFPKMEQSQDTPVSATEAITAPSAEASAEKTPAPKISHWIYGEFPSKVGPCTLNLHLSGEQFDERKIKDMILSIK